MTPDLWVLAAIEAVVAWFLVGWMPLLFSPETGPWVRALWPVWVPLYCLSRSGRWIVASMRALKRDLPTILRLMAGRDDGA